MQASEDRPAEPVIVPTPRYLGAAQIELEFHDGPITLSADTSRRVRVLAHDLRISEGEVIDRLIIQLSKAVREEHPDVSLSGINDLPELARLTVEKFSTLCHIGPQTPSSSRIG